jgi:site-specific recombinase XerD
MVRDRPHDAVAPALFRAAGTPLLRADEQVFRAMLDGWVAQQRSRGLRDVTINARLSIVTRFQTYGGEYPWDWRATDFEDWVADIRSDRVLAFSTLRAYQHAVSLFCEYLTDRRYAWAEVCEQHFGAYPSQIVFEWNAVQHRNDYEGRPQRRALRPTELQALFDLMDEEVVRLQRSDSKGWVAAMRDAAAFKTCYAFGLRRQELASLTLEDLGPNPHAPEFGDYGVVYVRHGKASRGGPAKRRSVLTVMPWSVDVLREWTEVGRALLPKSARSSALWPSERTDRVSIDALGTRFARYRDAAGLPVELSLHALRHSYVTHLIEAGYDPLFVQEQVGHLHASTTSIYTSVSSDFRTRTLRAALDRTVQRAIGEEP